MSDRIVIEVLDSGVGIAPENLSNIFAHGFTTKVDGHGFGLHSCANFARALGGRLLVHSDGPGCGAAFQLELPTGRSSGSLNKVENVVSRSAKGEKPLAPLRIHAGKNV